MTTKGLTKSARMVTAWEQGKDLPSIAKSLGVRYNFVYNVVSRHCKKHGLQMDTNTPKGKSKKSVIIELHDSTKLSQSEIAKEVGTHTSYVWQVISDHREQG